MSPLRILTVDDEVLALRRLKLLLQSIPQVEHAGEAGGCAEALDKIEALNPDVLLLDIKMRDGSGFDIVEAMSWRPNPPIVIFVTAFDQFAVRAFDRAVADYLLKPVERDRLIRTLERVRQLLKSRHAEQRVSELRQVVQNLRNANNEDGISAYDTEFWVRNMGCLVRVTVEMIDCVSSEDDYVAIHTKSGSYLMRTSIRQFAERVEPGLFVRVHRGWLVKKSAIVELRSPPLGSAEVVLRGGRRLPAGRVYLKQLRKEVQPARRPEARPGASPHGANGVERSL